MESRLVNIMLLKKPNDVGQQLDSVCGLKYIWMNLSIIGINPPSFTKKRRLWHWLYYLYSVLLNSIGSFLFPLSLLANLLFVKSWEEVTRNLSLSVTITFSSLKQLVIFIQLWRLSKANRFLRHLDLRCNSRKQNRAAILNVVRNCNFATLFYVIAYAFCCSGFAYIAWSNHTLYVDAYFPEFFTNPESNYLAAYLFQNLSLIFSVFQNSTNDVYPTCYVMLMISHLKALADRIASIGNGGNNFTIEENIVELKQCVQDHKNILSYFDCIRPVISSTIFMQFLITAFVLCITAINLIAFISDFTQQFAAIFYLGMVLIEVFPCCWYVNVLMERSDYLTTAMYSCNWLEQNHSFRKMLIIFMQRSQKSNIIVAGNLAPVTLQTFISILRFSFSMFTIISKVNVQGDVE